MPNAMPPAAAYQHAHEARQSAGGSAVPAPGKVTGKHSRIHGRDYYEFRGTDVDTVYAAALDCKNSIDIYRSPAVCQQYLDGQEHVVLVRAFTLD
ncbi:hypothetical protein ACKZDW_02310 (plasmid) [Ralstonia syzygii subsp. celebesensis]|uniref:hypothetical protein n=1 Tax=Ralstonia syzygii TaxID=28097 RepID=UPI00387E1948